MSPSISTNMYYKHNVCRHLSTRNDHAASHTSNLKAILVYYFN